MTIIRKIANNLGDVIHLPFNKNLGYSIPIFHFQNFKRHSKKHIELQVCEALVKDDLKPSHHGTEYFIWTDIVNILFCQAFLFKERGFWELSGWDRITNHQNIENCWELFEEHTMHNFFEMQWRHLEKLNTENLLNEFYLYNAINHKYHNDDKKYDEFKNFFLDINKFLNLQQRLWSNFKRKNISDKIFSYYNQDYNVTIVDKYKQLIYLNNNREYLPFYTQSGAPLNYYLELLQCLDKNNFKSFINDILNLHSKRRVQLGMPDIVVYDVNNKEHILLECKSPTDHLNLNQRNWVKRNIDLYKFNVGIVITSEKQIDEIKGEFSIL